MDHVGPGSRGAENAGCGERGVWKTRGVENAGCGKHGVWWKTRGLSEKHGGNVFSPKYEFSSLTWGVETCNENHGVKRVSQTFREKENHPRANVPCSSFLLHGSSILFFAITCVNVCFTFKKNIEIIKIVLLGILNREKRQLPYLLD